ncbi:choline/ethanolaminephosphotransferase 1-like [Chironomus tepperi]|uniref:choline/ethanolaminephosphotransferase 1-like n=1 Tax=Chironomus tepperi TaxID=113505 RepID=UPI00391EF8BF
MIFQRHKILNSSQLRKLADHKYAVTSSSLIEPYLQPYWNWLVLKLPLWIAPNLITIIGLLINILTSLALIYYNPDGKDTNLPPRWTYLLCAFGLFAYQSLDAIDGKQARRTGTSSPLGELFDHGCDSISTVFITLSTCSAIQYGSFPKIMFIEVFAVFALFYCSHWQAYISGTLHFGKIDVTEAHYSVISVHIMTFIFGPKIWSIKIFGQIELWYLIIAMTVLTGSLVISDFLATIRRGGSGKNGSTVAGTSIIAPILPFLFVIVPSYIIAVKSKSGIYDSHPMLYLMTFGILFAKITNKLVIAHLSKSEMDYLDSGMWGPFILFLNQYFNEFIPEYHLVWIAFIWCTLDLVWYCSNVCLDMCEYMNIKLFTIPYNPPKTAANGK